MVAVAFHKGFGVVGAANRFPAVAGAAETSKVGHPLVIECAVVYRDFFACSYLPARYKVQSFKPRIRIARMIDRLPVFRVLAPTHKNFVGKRIGVLREPSLLLGGPVLPDMRPAHQHVWLFFMSFDNLSGFDGFHGIHSVTASPVEDHFPFLMLPPMSFQGCVNDLLKKLPVAP